MPRTIVLCILGFLWTIFSIFFHLSQLDDTAVCSWTVTVDVIGIVILFLVWWLLILRPYLRMEREAALFMDGYTSEVEFSPPGL